MTEDKTTITDNEVIALIAEFMGLDIDGQNVTDGQQETTLDKLQYSTSWSWLMPVWYKFRDLKFETVKQERDYAGHKHEVRVAILYKDISEACRLLAEGIRWYNSVKK